ncbi:NAD(P)-dependent oxidoreductase [Spirillospora sp. CA-294931]|uniref:NAD(P)-dependent oxidoreductase n=1 Tax=Spirillospora sp. CA-294931 TaxID=3240042 RepID=UPI003D91BDB9
MHLTIFGATGAVGGELVRQAVDAGHDVTAVVRRPTPALTGGGRLTVATADLTDPASLVPMIDGCDAVLSAIGSPGRAVSTSRTDTAEKIIEAMAKASARRLIVVSASAAFTEEDDGPVAHFLVKPLVRKILKGPFSDARAMEAVVRESGLDWTIMRPPRLTDGRLTRDYRIGVDRGLRGGYRVARADLADCMLGLIDDPDFLHCTVTPGY